jgi:chromosome partitioning protein
VIITVGGIKGGSGKTTVATNLAIMRANEGHDVLLIDADDQETATDFTALRSERREGGAGYTGIKLTGPSVRTETLKLNTKYEDIVIDTGGRDTTSQRAALSVSDVLLIPFVPRSFDVWTIEKVAELVEEMRAANPNLRAITFINRADARGSDNEDAAQVLAESPALTLVDAVIGQRKAFGNAAAEGLAVTELRQPDHKATEEIKSLYSIVFDTIEVSTGYLYGIRGAG